MLPKWIVQVNPIIIYPYCHKGGENQDCFNCELYKKKTCNSPRGLCVREYYNHKNGCPNYNKNGRHCPPNSPIFDTVYDLSKPTYAIYNIFNFKDHVERMKKRHSHWTQRQVECCLYWQGRARKQLREKVEIFKVIFPLDTDKS